MKGESNMQMTRIDREDITTVIYSILTRKGLSVKFKVKLYTKMSNFTTKNLSYRKTKSRLTWHRDRIWNGYFVIRIQKVLKSLYM